MKVSKTDNRFKTGFPKPITGSPKKPILTSLHCSPWPKKVVHLWVITTRVYQYHLYNIHMPIIISSRSHALSGAEVLSQWQLSEDDADDMNSYDGQDD